MTEEGDVLRWNGTTWQIHASGLGALYAVWGSSPTDIWVGGELGLHHGTGTSSETLSFELESLPDATDGSEGPMLSIWGSSAVEWRSTGR